MIFRFCLIFFSNCFEKYVGIFEFKYKISSCESASALKVTNAVIIILDERKWSAERSQYVIFGIWTCFSRNVKIPSTWNKVWWNLQIDNEKTKKNRRIRSAITLRKMIRVEITAKSQTAYDPMMMITITNTWWRVVMVMYMVGIGELWSYFIVQHCTIT